MPWSSLLLLLLAVVTEGEGKVIKIPLQKRQPSRQQAPIRHRRRHNRATNGSIPVPIHGDLTVDGTYYVDVLIGGSTQSLILDTGSADVGVYSTGCKGCVRHINIPYDPANSTTAVATDCKWCSSHLNPPSRCIPLRQAAHKICTFHINYVDESGFKASIWIDDFSFSSFADSANKTSMVDDDPFFTYQQVQGPAVRSSIGAMYDADFDVPKEVDGIIGFADQSGSSSHSTTPFDDLVAAQQVADIFTICIHDKGGHLYLGSDEAAREEAVKEEKAEGLGLGLGRGLLGVGDDFQWTPRVQGSSFWTVNMLDLLVANKSIGVDPIIYNKGDAIVDSGSTELSVPGTAFAALKLAFGKLCATVCLVGTCDCARNTPLDNGLFDDQCVLMNTLQVAVYPVIEIVMEGGVKLQYPPSDYLKTGVSFCGAKGYYGLAIDGPDNDDDSGVIIGDTLMMGYLIAHDRRPPQQRIGFAPITARNCP